MPDTFRYSPNPNRASEISWRPWGEAAFQEAAALDRPVLLHLTAVWCHWCNLMDETTFSDPAIIGLVNEQLVAVRVDADRDPHVQDRYIAGGWPTTAFLTPTGEVLWAGTYTESAPLAEVAAGVLTAWRERRAELELEIERRHRAFEARHARGTAMGLVRREAADDVLTALRQSFDARNGGFGDEPKFPQTDAVELLYLNMGEDAAWGSMADQTLDGMLAGELWDGVDGGFFRYATAADWTSPRLEKLLETNASLLEAYALGAALRGRDDWRAIAERIVAWVDGTLVGERGFWAGSQGADPVWFAADAGERARLRPPRVDTTVYTSWNARWIAALARAGARLDRPEWVERADSALRALLADMAAPGGGVFHYQADGGEPRHDFLLADTLECTRAALALAQATGAADWGAAAEQLARHMERRWWAEDGGFWDRADSADAVGALRYRERPFEANAAAARVLLDLAQLTGDRGWRALAERTLARLGPHAGRYGAAGAAFAVAAQAFYEPPLAIFVTLPCGGSADDGRARALRQGAFALPVAGLRVWTVTTGHSSGPQHFAADGEPVAYVCARRGCSPPVAAPDRLAAAGAGVR
jgi:uncharacterized protein